MSNLIDNNPLEPNAPEPAEEFGNLIQHARYELERAGLFDDDADYGGAAGNAVMELIETFSSQHHSGMSAPLVLGLFSKLTQFQPLTEITSDPAEWVKVSDSRSAPLWQNKRRSTSFSQDGGHTWYDIEDPDRDNGARWGGWPQKDEPDVAR